VESTSKILQNQNQEQLSAERTNSNTAVTAVPNKMIDLIIDDYKHLTGGTTDRMSGWYAGLIRRLGTEQFIRLAKTAEQEGNNPARYFSWLLKREVQ
jgi:hypothetical protein